MIVADRNAPARRLYEALGYREQARAPIVNEDWACVSDDWVLMIKER